MRHVLAVVVKNIKNVVPIDILALSSSYYELDSHFVDKVGGIAIVIKIGL